MNALMSDVEILRWSLGLVFLAAAVATWKWRRGLAARRVAKGLRVYTAGAQVLS